MTAPKGLGAPGKALWKAVLGGLPKGWELDEREQEFLGLACHQADDLALLEKAITKTGAMVAGSKDQTVVNPAIPEARQARLAISRLLGALELPDAEEEPKTHAGLRGQRAARARWGRREHMEAMRNG